jgi:hypothetical protein
MSKYKAIIDDLRRDQAELLKLWSGLGTRQVRVTHHPPSGQARDVTQEHADVVRKAADSLHKVIAILEGLDRT